MPPKAEDNSGSSGMPAVKLDSGEVAQRMASFNLAADAKPSKFNGRPDTEGDVEPWIRGMERFGRANLIDNERLLQLVPMYLGGFAANWYDRETENGEKPFPSWQAFTKGLIGRFRPPDLTDKYKQELRSAVRVETKTFLPILMKN